MSSTSHSHSKASRSLLDEWGPIISSLLYLIPNYIIQLFVDGIVENNLIKEDMIRYFMIFGITMIFIYLTEATWVILTFGQSMKYQTELRHSIYSPQVQPPWFDPETIPFSHCASSLGTQTNGWYKLGFLA